MGAGCLGHQLRLVQLAPLPRAQRRHPAAAAHPPGDAIAALEKMGECGVKAGIVAGVKAADARGRELGEQLGKD